MEKEEKQSNEVYSWKEIVSGIKSPYNTYVIIIIIITLRILQGMSVNHR